MKTQLLSLLLVCFISTAYSQGDTLYTKKNRKIACKIVEINDYDIKYSLSDGPLIVVNRNDILKYRLSNGITEYLVQDELLVENEHREILNSRRVIKISPFSLVNSQISFAYENVIKVGMNVDAEAGVMSSSFNANGIFQNNSVMRASTGMPASYTGAYVKPGLKFFLGSDYSVRGLKYAHPLKGRYIRLDLAFSYLSFHNVSRQIFINGNPAVVPTYSTVLTDVTSLAYGGFVNYGRQFILGNLLTMEYFVGLGFTGQSNIYANPDYWKSSTYLPYYRGYQDAINISNYHGFMRMPRIGLSGTAGFRIGYIVPAKTKPPRR
jgi:hypothetical protein